MFEGSIVGDLTGIGFYVIFQLSGIWMMGRLLSGERFSTAFRCLLGSVWGSAAFQWFPLLFAFVLDFTVEAHLFGLLLELGLCVAVWWRTDSAGAQSPYRHIREWLRFLRENPCIVLMAACLVYFACCLLSHTIPVRSDGAVHTGQATYGDMNMHLGFITSIANQKAFPPEYSICPGFRLSYPFLCDSVSSSIYIWGASLRTAYIFPMLVALCQVMGGFYCFIKYWFQRSSSALIAWLLFFVNGGLGFLYFTSRESLAQNFTEFYFTPTSLGDKNIRWAQILVNMLLPQRATLFGWAVLFPLMALFLCAVRRRSRRCFALAGVLAGALPMIHTHSFLAFGLVCAVWLLWDCRSLAGCEVEKKIWLLAAVPLGLALFSLLQMAGRDSFLIQRCVVLLAGLSLLLGTIFFWIFQVFRLRQWKKLLATWGVFLAAVLVLAVPQLLYWTFGQAGADGFVRAYFNWSNTGDQYIWFYLKNIGLALVLFLPAWFLAGRKDLQTAAPLLLIWFVAELVVFQPNEYDNNKLLFVGYVFMCGLAADFLTSLFRKKWPVAFQALAGAAKAAAAIALLFLGTVSAVLTLGREWVSDYVLYSAGSVEACRQIEDITEPGDVVLTASNHNNAVASLTGRNIVCGAGTFLYYHGIDYSDRENDLALMYAQPMENKDLFEEYGVDYIYVSGEERSRYSVNDGELEQIADIAYSNEEVRLYRLRD